MNYTDLALLYYVFPMSYDLGPFLLTRINFNPGMDK